MGGPYVIFVYCTCFFWLGGSIEDLVLGRFLYNGASIREGCVDGGFGEMWEVDGVFFSSFFFRGFTDPLQKIEIVQLFCLKD